MNESFEYRGKWFLPESPDKAYYGVLTYEPDKGIFLTLDNWKDPQAISSEHRTFYPVLLGLIHASKEDSFSPEKLITLSNCHCLSPTHFLPSSGKFHVDTMFLNAHFNSADKIRFKRISVRFVHLDEWLWVSGFKPRRPTTKKEISIKYKLPKTITIPLDNYKISFQFSATTNPGESIVAKEINIEQCVWANFEPINDNDFAEFRRVINCFQNFLTIATLNSVYPLEVKGISEANKEVFKSKESYPSIQIFYKSVRFPNPKETIHPKDMLFFYRNIKGRRKKILSDWIKKDDKISTLFNLFLVTFNPNMYLEDEFLNLVCSLEALHRRTRKNQELSKLAHERRIESILKKTPSKYKDWLSGRLAYSNEPSLRKRLKNILNEFRPAISNVLKDENGFVNKVCDTRNYLTHYDLGLENKAAKNEELLSLKSKIKLLLILCFLREVGFRREEISKIINPHLQRF